MNEQQEIVNQASQAVAMPSNLGRGHEDHLEQGDFEIPRAKIVQFSSDEVKAVNPEDRIDAGKFINSVSKTEIPVEFIPIMRYKTYTIWNPKKTDDPNFDPAYEKGKMIFSTRDRHDPRIGTGLEFGPRGEKPKVTETFNFLCYFEGQRMPLLLSFQKTSLRAGKKLNTLLQEAGGDMFSNKFKLSFVIEGDPDKYYVMNVKGNGKATPQEFASCEAIYNQFRNVDIESKAVPQEAVHQD